MPKTKFGEETNEPTQPLKSQNKRAYVLKFSPNIKREMSIRYRSLKTSSLPNFTERKNKK